MNKNYIFIIISILSLLILYLLFFRKKENKTINKNIKTIEVKIKNNIRLSDLSTSMRCIKLSNDILIKSIDKLIIDRNENIYIQDEANEGILKFDPYGKLITQISKRGQGPGENISIRDFDIEQNNLIIFDPEKSCLLYYDLDGNFLYQKKYEEVGGANISITGDTVYFCSIYQMLSIYPSNKERIRPLKESFTTDDIFRTKTPFTKHGNQTYYTDAYTNTIYLATNGGIIPYIYIDFKDNNLPHKLKIDKNTVINELKNTDYCYCVQNVSISDSYIFFQFTHKNRIYNHIYNKNDDKNITWKILDNDINGIPLGEMVFLKENKLYYAVDSDFLYDAYTQWNDHDIKMAAKYWDMIQPLDEMDNPYIFVVTVNSL